MRRAIVISATAAALALAVDGGDGPAAEPSGPASLGFQGHVLLKNFTYFEEASTEPRRFLDEAIFQLEWARQFGPWVGIKLVGDARGDDDDFTEGVRFQIPDTARQRSHLNLVEAVLRVGRAPLELTLGKQIYAWGTADAYNPTDNINPYDYLDPIDHHKMGVYSAALHGTLGPSSVTVVVIPVFTPSRVPLPSSRWLPTPPTEPGPVVIDRQLPSTSYENIQWAARVRTTFRGWDVALSYFEGFEDTPVFRQSIAQLTPLVAVPQLTPVFTRLRAPGLDFSTTYRKFEFHGEFAAKLVESNGAEDRVQGIVGLNYTWDEFGLAWLEQINGILEYAREEALATVDPTILRGSAATPAALPNSAFRNALVGRLRFKFTENTEVKLSGTADFAGTLNYYVQAKLNHKFTDSLQLETGLDFFAGASDTFWGRWALPLRDLRSIDKGLTIVGEADGLAVIESLLARFRPQVLLVTPAAAGDLETIRRIHERHPATRSIVLSEGRPMEDLSSYIAAGARGVVSERESGSTLVKAIRAVLGGEIWAGRKVVARAIERLVTAAPAPVAPEPSTRARLTRGELAVAELVAQGCRNEEIAKRLGRSERTVRNHLTRIFRKLDCRNRVTLTALLLQEPATAADHPVVTSLDSSSFQHLEHGGDSWRPRERRAPGAALLNAKPPDPAPPSASPR